MFARAVGAPMGIAASRLVDEGLSVLLQGSAHAFLHLRLRPLRRRRGNLIFSPLSTFSPFRTSSLSSSRYQRSTAPFFWRRWADALDICPPICYMDAPCTVCYARSALELRRMHMRGAECGPCEMGARPRLDDAGGLWSD
jgi:hypothetical protein